MEKSHFNPLFKLRMIKNYFQARIDRLVLYPQHRWIAFTILVMALFLRSFAKNGYYAIIYLFFFFVLQRLVLFVTPAGVPSISEEEDENEEIIYELPEHYKVETSDDPSKPVVRRMGEFRLW